MAELIEIRNKLVHANITDIDYRNIIEKDSFLLRSTVNRMTFNSNDLICKRKAILNTIKIILRSMETESRNQLKSVLNEYYIGYIIKDEVVYFVQEKLYD